YQCQFRLHDRVTANRAVRQLEEVIEDQDAGARRVTHRTLHVGAYCSRWHTVAQTKRILGVARTRKRNVCLETNRVVGCRGQSRRRSHIRRRLKRNDRSLALQIVTRARWSLSSVHLKALQLAAERKLSNPLHRSVRQGAVGVAIGDQG